MRVLRIHLNALMKHDHPKHHVYERTPWYYTLLPSIVEYFAQVMVRVNLCANRYALLFDKTSNWLHRLTNKSLNLIHFLFVLSHVLN